MTPPTEPTGVVGPRRRNTHTVSRLPRPAIPGRAVPRRAIPAGRAAQDPALPIGFCPVCGQSYAIDPQQATTCPRDGSIIEGSDLSCVWLG